MRVKDLQARSFRIYNHLWEYYGLSMLDRKGYTNIYNYFSRVTGQHETLPAVIVRRHGDMDQSQEHMETNKHSDSQPGTSSQPHMYVP